MRNVGTHLLEDKMDESVSHYINSHQSSAPVHIDTNCMPINLQDDGGGRVTVMHQQTYTTQMLRQVSVTEQVGEGPWGEELLEGPIAAIVAQLQNSRGPHHHPNSHHKVAAVRSDVDTSVILDGSIRFNGQALEHQSEPIVVQLPPMQTLPPLQDIKRCETDWFSDKNKKDGPMLPDSDSPVLELAGASPAHHKQQNKKSLPHKKRISRKLKRNNGHSTPQQDIVVINCSEPVAPSVEQEQILPDTFTVPVHTQHISHEVRPVFICQICGDYYGDEQLKFYQHLKQHYDPHATIIIENPVSDLAIDKLTNNCIVDNVATLPDSIVELSLENTVPKTMYQPMEKHILYTTSDKTLTYNSNKVQYSMASMDKEHTVQTSETEKLDVYETLDKLELYNCGKCSKTFRKQKQCEAHMREAHSNTKLEDMGEFSEPEDLMAGIQVCVGEGEPYEQTLLPHLTVENGHVHQEHTRHWFSRGGGGGQNGAGGCGASGGYCGVCARESQDAQPLKLLKEEVLQRIFDGEVSDNATFGDNIIPDNDVGEHEHSQEHHEHPHNHHEHGHENHEHGYGNHEHSHGNHEHSHGNHEHSHGNHEHSHGNHEQGHGNHEHGHRNDEHCHGNDEHGHGNHVHGNENDEHRDEIGHHNHEHEHSQEHHEHGQEQEDSQEPIQESMHERNGALRVIEVKTGIDAGRVKKYECPDCERVFSHRNSLLYHALSHGGKQHACGECGKGFYTVGALNIHNRTHNGDRPYKCVDCGKGFRQWSDLKYHTISLHSDKKLFKCEFCGKEFARKYSLNVHVRIHTGEKNYKCDYCSKTFRASSYRLSHMRTHTGDRPYKCDECLKCFRSGFDLRRHALIHDKMRNRFDEQKPKPKDNKKTKMTDTKEEKIEKDDPPLKKIKRIAAVSTTGLPSSVKPTKKNKKTNSKKGAPNVTVQNRDIKFKVNDYNNVEVFEKNYNRQDYIKFKDVYSESDFKGPIGYREEQSRDFAVLRPMFRNANTDNVDIEKPVYRENTDGKMQVYTHVEKGKDYSGSTVSNTQVLGDIRHLERDVAREVRSEMNGEVIETAFLERLTAMYNISAV